METTFGFAPVAAITVICFLAGMGAKLSPLKDKWIPLISGGLGCLLGLAAYFAVPAVMPAGDPFTAAAIGIVSGYAATGVHQTVSQLSKERGR